VALIRPRGDQARAGVLGWGGGGACGHGRAGRWGGRNGVPHLRNGQLAPPAPWALVPLGAWRPQGPGALGFGSGVRGGAGRPAARGGRGRARHGGPPELRLRLRPGFKYFNEPPRGQQSGKELSHNEGGWGSAGGLKMAGLAGSGRRADLDRTPGDHLPTMLRSRALGVKAVTPQHATGHPDGAPCCGPPARRPFFYPASCGFIPPSKSTAIDCPRRGAPRGLLKQYAFC
jgi:hypothetical protein